MSKHYDFWKRMKGDASAEQAHIASQLRNKYYNLWMNKYIWSGLDEDNKEQEQAFLMRKFWSVGKVAIRNIPNANLLAITEFGESLYNMYDYPVEVNLINNREQSKNIVPETPQIVGKTVGIVYAQPNQKPIKYTVDYYIDRIAEVEMVLRTNLVQQQMPFIVTVDEETKKQIDDILLKLSQHEPIITAGAGDIKNIQSLITTAPYIIDKLKQYMVSLENELLTYLGVDNSGSAQKSAQLTVDEVNTNNDCINEFGDSITDEIQRGLDTVNRTLGRNIRIELRHPVVDSTHDMEVLGGDEKEDDEP